MAVHGDRYVLDAGTSAMRGSGSARSTTSEHARCCSLRGLAAGRRYVNRPVDAMRSIYAALEPGGVIVYEDADMSAMYAEPPSGYHEYVALAFAVNATLGVDYAAGRHLHRWASEADVLRDDAYHPHYLTGEQEGFWSWTYRETGASLVKPDDPLTVVAHARMHQLAARKPEPSR